MTMKYLVCDRCGAQKLVPDDTTAFEVERTYAGWARADGDRFLCPECSPAYELLLARHKVELEDYITGGDRA